ncbi:hypothetical protein SLE2022_327630 [Rubroshorea leprosula]
MMNEPANLDEGTLQRGSPVGTEVIGRFAIGAEINRPIIIRAAAIILIGEIIRNFRDSRRRIQIRAIGEKQINLLKTPRAICLRPDLPRDVSEIPRRDIPISIIVVPAADVPLVALLNPDEGLLPTVGSDVQVIEMGGDEARIVVGR